MLGHPSPLPLERFTSFGDLLKFLRRRAGLTQRELSIAVGYSHAQVSRLELNQRVPDLATIGARFVPALDLDRDAATASRLLELAGMPREAAPTPGLAPFKGLQFFDEADADLFFGRETLTAKLGDRIRACLSVSPPLRFLAVVGASGSGKSSIVRAGLIPALRRSASFERWEIHCLTPTARPLHALAASLTREAGSISATTTVMDDLARDRRALDLGVARLLEIRQKDAGQPRPRSPQGVLLVVDQFEELFTLCRNEAERRAFVENLMTAVSQHDGATFVVLTLRADFYPACAPYAELRQALAQQQEYIGTMSAEELRRAIEEPTRRGQWNLEPGLVELLLQDVGAEGGAPPEPGAMPLLSHALLETWHRRRGRTMTVSAYLASGGVSGAIAETADAVFQDQLDADQQAIARNIFQRLTQLGEDETVADTRRRIGFDELIRTSEDAAPVREVLTLLADARLITTDEGVVEVAHEALIREWPTLRNWLEQDREGLRLHRHLTLAAESWERRRRDVGELYRGTRLSQAMEWAEANPAALSGLETAFLDASRALAERDAAEREAQRRRELEAAQALAETQRQAAEQLRRRARYLAGAFVLAVGMAGLALWQGERARQSAVTAQQERRTAFSRELAAAAMNNLEIDPERSILLTLYAASVPIETDEEILPEVKEALHRSIVASQVRLSLAGHETRVLTAGFSPDGEWLATIGNDGVTIVWDADTGAQRLRLPGTTEPSDYFSTQRLAFSPDGRRLATADSSLVRIWDTESGDLVRTLEGHEGDVWSIAFSRDGRSLAAGSADNTVRVWDAESGEPRRVLTGHAQPVGGVAFSPDGRWLASGADDSTLKLWDATTGEMRREETFSDFVDSVSFSPDGAFLAATTGDGLRVWRVVLPQNEEADLVDLEQVLAIDESVGSVTFSPDGGRLAAVIGSAAKLWDARTGRELMTLPGHTNWVTDVAFSPDGTSLATTSFDGTARMWSLLPGEETTTVVGEGLRVAFSPDGATLATDSADGATLWDARTGRALLDLAGHSLRVMGVAFSPDGKRLATASLDATAKEWETTSGRQGSSFIGHEVGVRDIAYSPDGSRIATAGFDQTARIWDARTGDEILNLLGHQGLVLGVAFSPDGTRLVTSSTDSTARMWDATTGEFLFTMAGHADPIPDIAFSPDGTKVATASQDATGKIWDATTGVELLTLSGHGAEIQSVAFSPDGKWLATGSGDNTARVWDAATGELIQTLPGSLGGVTGVAFSPVAEDALLGVASSDGVVRVFLLRTEDLLALARSRVTRTLRQPECQQFLHMEQCPASDL